MNIGAADTGDGAAPFIILIESAILIALAFWLDFRFHPPLWVHAVVWPVIAVPTTIGLMRPCKAFLVAQQFHNRPDEMGAG